MNPLILTVAGVGAELTPADTPYLPVTPEQIIEAATRVAIQGATIFHLHVRDDAGHPTLDPGRLHLVIEGIRKQCSMLIQVSTGGALSDRLEDRLRVLDLDCEMASLTLGSVNFGTEVFQNPRPLIEALAARMMDRKIKPELEVFDVGMVDEAHHLIAKRLLTPPHHFNIILGGPGWLGATEENLAFILKKLPAGSTWSASGVGRFQKPMITYAIREGGHVRTGLEDNIYLEKGILAKGNQELVGQALELARSHNRRLATINETKQLLGL